MRVEPDFRLDWGPGIKRAQEGEEKRPARLRVASLQLQADNPVDHIWTWRPSDATRESSNHHETTLLIYS